MNKTELIDAIAEEAGLSKADAKKALEAFLASIEKTLKKGDKISLVGFGSGQYLKNLQEKEEILKQEKLLKLLLKK